MPFLPITMNFVAGDFFGIRIDIYYINCDELGVAERSDCFVTGEAALRPTAKKTAERHNLMFRKFKVATKPRRHQDFSL